MVYFWFEQEHSTGWGLRTVRDMIRQPGEEPNEVGTHIPWVFLERYIEAYAGTELAESLKDKLVRATRCPVGEMEIRNPLFMHRAEKSALEAYGNGILELQEDSGCFPVRLTDTRSATWRPVGINHWPFAENIYKAMSNEGDIVLENNVVSALHLLKINEITGQEKYASAAYRALDYCLPMLVADGGDAWETLDDGTHEKSSGD